MSSQYLYLTVKEITVETEDTKTIHFWHPIHAALNYKSGQFLTVIPEIKGQITEIREAGKAGDLKESLDLINLGWPVVVLVVDGVKHYGIPKSFRERVDVDTQKISALN